MSSFFLFSFFRLRSRHTNPSAEPGIYRRAPTYTIAPVTVPSLNLKIDVLCHLFGCERTKPGRSGTCRSGWATTTSTRTTSSGLVREHLSSTFAAFPCVLRRLTSCVSLPFLVCFTVFSSVFHCLSFCVSLPFLVCSTAFPCVLHRLSVCVTLPFVH